MSEITQRVDLLEKAAQRMLGAISEAYKIMNYYGSKEQMEKWSCPDPMETMMHVYYVMADPYNNLKRVLGEE